MSYKLEDLEVEAIIHTLRTNDLSSGRGKTLNERIAEKLEQQLAYYREVRRLENSEELT